MNMWWDSDFVFVGRFKSFGFSFHDRPMFLFGLYKFYLILSFIMLIKSYLNPFLEPTSTEQQG